MSYLSDLRKAKGMSITELAEKSTLSHSTVAKWEREGVPDNAIFDHVYKYTNALGLDITVVMYFSDLHKEAFSSKENRQAMGAR